MENQKLKEQLVYIQKVMKVPLEEKEKELIIFMNLIGQLMFGIDLLYIVGQII